MSQPATIDSQIFKRMCCKNSLKLTIEDIDQDMPRLDNLTNWITENPPTYGRSPMHYYKQYVKVSLDNAPITIEEFNNKVTASGYYIRMLSNHIHYGWFADNYSYILEHKVEEWIMYDISIWHKSNRKLNTESDTDYYKRGREATGYSFELFCQTFGYDPRPACTPKVSTTDWIRDNPPKRGQSAVDYYHKYATLDNQLSSKDFNIIMRQAGYSLIGSAGGRSEWRKM